MGKIYQVGASSINEQMEPSSEWLIKSLVWWKLKPCFTWGGGPVHDRKGLCWSVYFNVQDGEIWTFTVRAFDAPRPERTITVNYDGFAEGNYICWKMLSFSSMGDNLCISFLLMLMWVVMLNNQFSFNWNLLWYRCESWGWTSCGWWNGEVWGDWEDWSWCQMPLHWSWTVATTS